MIGLYDRDSPGTPSTPLSASSVAPLNRSASLQEQVTRALQTPFLLLHQPAPNVFILLDPSPATSSVGVGSVCQWETAVGCPVAAATASASKRQRFRVTLGGHSPGCSCCDQPLVSPASTRSPCAHTLFVLLRILHLRPDDPRISRPRLENYEVEPLLQRYARLRASNFRRQGSNSSSSSCHALKDSSPVSASGAVASGGAANPQPSGRIVMPRPIALSASPSACALPTLHGHTSTECSELSSITRSIEPMSCSSSLSTAAVCRRCLSHAPTPAACGVGGGSSGAGCGGRPSDSVGPGRSDSAEGQEAATASAVALAAERRPKTEPQGYYGTMQSSIDQLNANSRHALSTTFRPIGEPTSNPETDPETEGVSSSSRSSRFEETGPSRRSTSPDPLGGGGDAPSVAVCRLCLREFRPPSATALGSSEHLAAVCSALDCSAVFHQDCFSIWQEECEGETGSLYCPVCGRVWTNARTPTNQPDWTGVRSLPHVLDAAVVAPPQTQTSAESQDAISTWAPAGATGVDTESFLLLQNQIIPGLRSTLSVWKSVFSEEVAMGIISPYWHVRQSALRQVAKITICRVLMARKTSTPSMPTSATAVVSEPGSLSAHDTTGATANNLGCESLRMSIRLIQYLLSDPADDVFIASLCAFREILGYLICLDSETMTALQRTIAPVLRRLLIFVGGYLAPGFVPINSVANLNLPAASTSVATAAAVAAAASASGTVAGVTGADGVVGWAPPPDQHRRANLALATLVELAKGQEGEMSIGRDTSNAEECMSISGLPHLAHFLLRSAKFHQTHLVGRLKLLEKLVEMHCETVARIKAGGDATVTKDAINKRISYRHLCSSLIFARRHVYPPEQPVFPHNLVSEGAMATRMRRNAPGLTNQSGSPLKVVGGTDQEAEEVKVSSFACLMEANIKASRLARRVFITVARALLQEPRIPGLSPSSANSSSSLPDAESFVNAEIKLLDVSLAAKLRSKLADVLQPTTTSTISTSGVSSNPITSSSGSTNTTSTVSATVTMSPSTNLQPTKTHEVPPIPPPRRFSQTKAPAAPPIATTRIITPSGVRIALEPAYDHVALSETTGVYSSSDEEEDAAEGDEEPLEKLDWEEVGTAQQQHHHQQNYQHRERQEPASVPVVPSPAELSALKTALRRAAWSPVPLVTIPNLAQKLDLKNPLKSECKYKEGVDWLLGPFLGKGAFSLCYQARDVRTGTLMAVKRLRFVGDSASEAEEQLSTAREEVEIMRRIYHPNVLRLFGIVYNSEKKHVDIFVEWMPGGSITSLLNQYGAFTEPVSLAYILQVIRGIACLHKHGILHRDLKGANLLVDCTGSVVRISDFGASARLGSQGSVAGQFQGQVIGTFAFMAPEVLRGEAYGRACDIWSVGCCLLEMLSGKPPWNDSRLTNQYALMFTIASTDQPPPYPKTVSPAVKQFLDSCFNRNPEQRPIARRLLQHCVFSAIISAPEPATDTSQMNGHSPTMSSLSKSFTAASLSSNSSSISMSPSTRGTSRHRALPPVPREEHTSVSPSPNYDKLIVQSNHLRQQPHQQQQPAMVVPGTQRRVCRNQ